MASAYLMNPYAIVRWELCCDNAFISDAARLSATHSGSNTFIVFCFIVVVFLILSEFDLSLIAILCLLCPKRQRISLLLNSSHLLPGLKTPLFGLYSWNFISSKYIIKINLPHLNFILEISTFFLKLSFSKTVFTLFFPLIHDPNWVSSVYHAYSHSSIKKHYLLFESYVCLLHTSPSKTHLEWSLAHFSISNESTRRSELAQMPLVFLKMLCLSSLYDAITTSVIDWLIDWLTQGLFKKAVHLHAEGLHAPGVAQPASVKPTKSWCADNKWASAVFIYSR